MRLRANAVCRARCGLPRCGFTSAVCRTVSRAAHCITRVFLLRRLPLPRWFTGFTTSAWFTTCCLLPAVLLPVATCRFLVLDYARILPFCRAAVLWMRFSPFYCTTACVLVATVRTALQVHTLRFTHTCARHHPYALYRATAQHDSLVPAGSGSMPPALPSTYRGFACRTSNGLPFLVRLPFLAFCLVQQDLTQFVLLPPRLPWFSPYFTCRFTLYSCGLRTAHRLPPAPRDYTALPAAVPVVPRHCAAPPPQDLIFMVCLALPQYAMPRVYACRRGLVHPRTSRAVYLRCVPGTHIVAC